MLPRIARADPIPLELSWEAPPECPSYADVVAELDRIARVPADRVVTTLHAHAVIERVAGRYKLRLSTERDDHHGQTELETSSCGALKRGATLVLALALGEGVRLMDPKPLPARPPTEKEVAVVPTRDTTPPPLHSPNDAQRRLAWSPWVAARAASGLLGPSSFGADLGAGLRTAAWQAFVRATLWAPSRMADVANVKVQAEGITAAAGVCARAPFADGSFAGCAALEAGLLRGWSEGAPHDGSTLAPWYAATPSLLFERSLSRSVLLRLEMGLAVSLDPPIFAVQPIEAYRVARLVPTASLGVAFE